MSDKKMNVGFIGCGGFVQGNHLPNAYNNPNLNVRALCDLNADILEKLQKQYGVDYVTADMNTIAADDKIELVVIGTNPDVRVAPIRAMAQAGKHILVEKPMSLGCEDSKQIVDIIQQTGVKLQVGFNRPYSKIMQEAIRQDKPTQTNAYRGALATIIGVSAIKSLETHQPVDFDFSFLKHKG